MSDDRTRRVLLRATAGLTLTGLAGCLGGPSDSSDGTRGSDGGDDQPTSGPAETGPETTPAPSGDETGTGSAGSSTTQQGGVPCVAVDDGYTRFDPGAVPSVAGFEYPAIFGDLETSARGQMVARGRREVAGDPGGELAFRFTQLTTGYRQSSLQGPGDDDRAVATTVDFNGEETYVVSNPNSPANSVSLQASLPYDIDGETRYFSTNVDLTKTDTKRLAGDCKESMVAAARHLANSLRPNPDSTIAEAGT